jgi:hypothetical protein
MSSPAEILRAFLVREGVLAMPFVKGKTVPIVQHPLTELTPCYVSSMPDDPDQAVTIYDVSGIMFGRRQPDGKQMLHPGMSVLVRTINYGTGYNLTNMLAVVAETLDSSQSPVVVNDQEYWVQTVYRTSTVTSLGEEVGNKRQRFSFDLRMALQDRQPSLG